MLQMLSGCEIQNVLTDAVPGALQVQLQLQCAVLLKYFVEIRTLTTNVIKLALHELATFPHNTHKLDYHGNIKVLSSVDDIP